MTSPLSPGLPPGLPPQRLAYDDLASPQEMLEDARATRAAILSAPSLRYEDYPREVPKREITISEAAVRLADALHLHLD